MNAVNAAVKVNLDTVAGLRRAVIDRHEARVLLALLLQSLVEILLGHLGICLLDLNALVSAELHFRLGRNRSRVDQILILADLGHIDLRAGHDRETALLRSLRIGIIDAAVHSALKEDALAVVLLDHSLRNMALPETLHLILRLLAVVRCGDCLLKIFLRHGHRDHCHIVFFLLYLKCHRDFLLDICSL